MRCMAYVWDWPTPFMKVQMRLSADAWLSCACRVVATTHHDKWHNASRQMANADYRCSCVLLSWAHVRAVLCAAFEEQHIDALYASIPLSLL
eukprot:1158261-Pelagomonas_calceolata.AAC.8